MKSTIISEKQKQDIFKTGDLVLMKNRGNLTTEIVLVTSVQNDGYGFDGTCILDKNQSSSVGRHYKKLSSSAFELFHGKIQLEQD